MTAYLANHQKKVNIFKKRVQELEHALKHDFSQEKIVKAAEKVREARLKVFKARFSQYSILPASKWQPDEEATRWQEMDVQEIVQKCTAKKLKL